MSKIGTIVVYVTAELNQHLYSPVSMVTVRKFLHKQSIYGRGAITKPFVTDVNATIVYSGVSLTKPGRVEEDNIA
ncbi:hypothetical protein TNCV_1263221 [Trichonephila clavipes]|nr:hypothetical protein TNCV_1263221 [Trichonephila clavipes]